MALQVTAAFIDCKFVNKMELKTEQRADGNYRFTAWKGRGVACNP
jgi:hypothetical protein